MSRFVDQSKFGAEEGDCLNAALASMLCVPLADVPDFTKAGPTEDCWFAALRDWLASRGWGLLSVKADPHVLSQRPMGLLMVGGTSPRGLFHQTIWRDGAMVHDPHPSRSGIEKPLDIDIIYPLDPAAFTLTEPHIHGTESKEKT